MLFFPQQETVISWGFPVRYIYSFLCCIVDILTMPCICCVCKTCHPLYLWYLLSPEPCLEAPQSSVLKHDFGKQTEHDTLNTFTIMAKKIPKPPGSVGCRDLVCGGYNLHKVLRWLQQNYNAVQVSSPSKSVAIDAYSSTGLYQRVSKSALRHNANHLEPGTCEFSSGHKGGALTSQKNTLAHATLQAINCYVILDQHKGNWAINNFVFSLLKNSSLWQGKIKAKS